MAKKITKEEKVDTKIDDLNDEEIQEIQKTLKEKIEKKEGDTYSKAEVNKILADFEKKIQSRQSDQDDNFIDLLDPNAKKRMFVRLARLNNKFIVGRKNMQSDSYSDEPIYVENVENPKKKGEFIPMTTFILEDGETLIYPYLSFMNRAVGVWAEVIEEKKEDTSESFGVINVMSTDEKKDDWDMKSTGKKVLAKALKHKTTYVCRDLKTNKTIEVEEAVVNKVDAPYSTLAKYLEQNN